MTAAVFDYPAIAEALARIEGREPSGQTHDPYGAGETINDSWIWGAPADQGTQQRAQRAASLRFGPTVQECMANEAAQRRLMVENYERHRVSAQMLVHGEGWPLDGGPI